MDNINACPHSPDVTERETLDGGFSRGWGFHFQPNEAYWLDCHAHMSAETAPARVSQMLDDWFGELDAYRLGRVVAIAQSPKAFKVYRDIAAQDKRFSWLFWMPHDKPDPELMQRALENGALGVKLHNSPLMQGEGAPDVWLQSAWDKVFAVLDRAGRSVLWHVTQRLSVSPYHGGGAESYWRDGRAKGVKTTNEELLQVFLQVVRRYPRIAFIGAHQLHVGLDRLAALFAEHKNLAIDTSCGFFVRWADVLYDSDREILRRFFLKYPDRILFGTDASLAVGAPDPYMVQAFLCHARFINQLRLPDDVLARIAHGNAERIFGLEALKPQCRGNTRP